MLVMVNEIINKSVRDNLIFKYFKVWKLGSFGFYCVYD